MPYVLGKRYVDGGIWFDYPAGGRFLVARYESNIEFVRVQRELERVAKETPGNIMPDGEFDPEVQLDIATECYARTILKDWAEVVDESGQAVTYTWELGKTMILDDREFSDWLAGIARNEANFRAGEVDGTAKK